MKTKALIALMLLTAACTSNPKVDKVAMHDENDKLCENHKDDYNYFRAAFAKEHAAVCADGCAYTPTMNKNSDAMERIAGVYYLMSCDYNHGRL